MAKINEEKIAAARETLPPELQNMLREFAEDYMAASELHVKGGKAFVNYNILAELLKCGWRKAS